MSNPKSRREFLTTFGLATSALGWGSVALAQENGHSPSQAQNRLRQIPEHPYDLMICDHVRFKISKVDKRGEVVWEHTPKTKV